MRVGLVGAGRWATEHHIPAVQASKTGTLAAIYDADPVRAAKVAADFGLGADAVARDIQTLAENVDAAVIASPHPAHAEAARILLEAGVPVLIEKPLATSFADAMELVELSERLGVPLIVGYTSQFSRAAAQAKAWLAELGPLSQCVIEFHSAMKPTFEAAIRPSTSEARGWEPADPSTYSSARQGGQSYSQLSHALGMFTWATDDEGAELFAYANTYGFDLDVDAVVAMRTRTQATVTAATCGALPVGTPSRQVLRFIARDGVVEIDILGARATLTTADGGTTSVEPEADQPGYDTHAPVHALLALAADGGAGNPAPGRPAAAAVAIIESMHRSIASGTPVTVPAVRP